MDGCIKYENLHHCFPKERTSRTVFKLLTPLDSCLPWSMCQVVFSPYDQQSTISAGLANTCKS